MLKKIGFIVILVGLLVALRPVLFQNLFDTSAEIEHTTDLPETADEMYEQETQYAEGYNAESFGAAFTSDTEEMFPMEDIEPPSGVWGALLQLEFKHRYDTQLDHLIADPLFTKDINELEGQIIELEGFIIPQDIAATSDVATDDGQRFMFSAFPIASCFFCGGAGAESVVEALPKEPIPYTKMKIKIRGKLRFNRTDYLKLPYMLDDVILVTADI